MRKRKLMRAMMAVIAAASLAGPAMADPPLGSRLGSDHSTDKRAYSERDAALSTRAFVACLLTRDVNAGQTMLTTGDKAVADKAYRSLLRWAVNGCSMLGDATSMSDEVGFNIPDDVFRGMVAEKLIERRLDTLAVLPALPVQMTYSRPWFAVSGRDNLVNEMAVCLAESDPSGTAAMMRTKPYTDEEMAAIQGLGPALQKCLRVGVSLHANRQTLRAALAEGAYNRLINPAVPPATVAKP